MPSLVPFRALRPRASNVAQIASVPYDVVTTAEAREIARGNPLSFLHVSRAEIDLPDTTDPYSDAVYTQAAANFEALTRSALVLEDDASLYVYRLRSGDHEQVGLAACYSLDDYDRNLVRKHERTRRDKEDDRTRHMIALGAQTGPVFLTYRASAEVTALTARAVAGEPLFDFEASDGVRHTVWQVSNDDCDRLVEVFRGVGSLYIADGHHRAASAARARATLGDAGTSRSLADRANAGTFLAVAFPHDQVQILPYNRIVRNLGNLTREQFGKALAERFAVTSGPPSPKQRGEVAMYFEGTWRTLVLRDAVAAGGPGRRASQAVDAVRALDVSVLQDELLRPVLAIQDVRTDRRIDFVGGARGIEELERLVDSGEAAVAFSLYPVSVDDLMAVSDAGEMMPPKSTWFEPKLRDGLLIHLI